MLELREADLPALFLVLVVFPVVTYILLGRWNEAAKKNARISVLAQLAAEEALRVEKMACVDVVPVVALPKYGIYECARCFAPATTRCSRCKSIRYCSGKCQIIHWRQGHKKECQQWERSCLNLSTCLTSKTVSTQPRALIDEDLNSHFLGSDMEHLHKDIPFDQSVDPCGSFAAIPTNMINGTCQVSAVGTKLPDKKMAEKLKRERPRYTDNVACSFEEAINCGAAGQTLNLRTFLTELSPTDVPLRHKLAIENSNESDEIHKCKDARSSMFSHSPTVQRNSMHTSHKSTSEMSSGHKAVNSFGISSSVPSGKIEINECDASMEFTANKFEFQESRYSSATGALGFSSAVEKGTCKGGVKYKKPPYSLGPMTSVPQNPANKVSKAHPPPGIDSDVYMENETRIPKESLSANIPLQDFNGLAQIDETKIGCAKKIPKVPKRNLVGFMNLQRKNKVLFPYEDLVKFFQCEAWDISPRGLVNCGNSCYANAVLQCLTCTKPLMIYLLQRLHSKNCMVRDWCLMCELERHVAMLREDGGPVSPSRILSNMRNNGWRMGGGKQEDAHEFLRLLVMSMQSICLEGLGGEKEVDPRLQETTLIQQIFGGRIRSKVKCMQCHIESERYENVMDLTLEIHGWVESLEDALTQFTAAEDLDGENMYRCGRCSAYVKARKQLSLHEVPNILTVVLKRFQTGQFGKINKCVTFPDMLDMIPFMTGTADVPPLYILYAVVVHLDTLNTLFSGHYVSYVKDLQGTWFRVDDSEVQAVPFSQVMSEGAYMLFYSRSYPRPPRAYARGAPVQHQASVKPANSKGLKSSKHEQNKQVNSVGVGNEVRARTRECIEESIADYAPHWASRNVIPRRTYGDSSSLEFSDATSSDWSLFTSSDESSFTTESTRDSFSTVDYGDGGGLDPISSIFGPVYGMEYPQSNTISCKKFSPCLPETRFFSENKAFVLDSSERKQLHGHGSVHKGRHQERVSTSLDDPASGSHSSFDGRYWSKPKDSYVQTLGYCHR